MEFYFPWMLLAGLLIPLLLFASARRERKALSLGFSDTGLLQGLPESPRRRWHRPILNTLRFLILAGFILALGRPRILESEVWQASEGIDILMVLDVSTSMLAEDFTWGRDRTSRFDAVKRVTRDFIAARPQDRIGLVLFAGEPFTLCPLTTDSLLLADFLERISMKAERLSRSGQGQAVPLYLDDIPVSLEDGTAIGEALAFGTARLRQTPGKSRVLILLTDGDNNRGDIDPRLGAELAASQGIRVYTIGAGSMGPVPFPVMDPVFGKRYQRVSFPLDEATLRQIAATTGGEYFSAKDTGALREIYSTIDAMETTVSDTAPLREYREVFPWFLVPALVLLFLETLLKQTFFLKIP